MKQTDIGLIGLAVMGENLVMNMASKGFTVAVYNRTPERWIAFSAVGPPGSPSSAATLPRSWSVIWRGPARYF